MYRWRLQQALDLGATFRDAEDFADSHGDLAQLRHLIERAGCDPHTAVQILS